MLIVNEYRKRISGPIQAPIDIHLDIHRVPFKSWLRLMEMILPTIRQRVEAACAIRQARFVPLLKPKILVNGDMGPSELQKFCQLDKEGLVMIRMGVEHIGLACESNINVTSNASPSTFREDYLSGLVIVTCQLLSFRVSFQVQDHSWCKSRLMVAPVSIP